MSQEHLRKPTPKTNHKIHPLITGRWSPRAFADRPLEGEVLAQLFEAARWAPSSFNEQPWRFLYFHRGRDEGFQKLVDCLSPGNQEWASEAAVLVLTATSTHFQRNGKTNRHAFHDVGLAVANLSLQATELDIYVHQMAGFEPEKAHKTFQLPEHIEPVTVIALGYLADPAELSEEKREKEYSSRTRKPQSEFVFHARWGS